MRVLWWLVLVVCSTVALAEPPKFRMAARPVPNEYIVVLKSIEADQVPAVAEQLAAAFRGELFGPPLVHGIKGFAVRMSDAQAHALSRHPFVEFVEQNGYADISYTVQEFPNDTFWNLDRVDNLGPIYSYKAYGYTYTGSNVRAYVIDTGVQARHFEFDLDGFPGTTASRVETGANMVVSWGDSWPANNPCGGYVDAYGPGHGTAVASVLGGREVGVAKSVAIVPVKVATCSPFQVYTLAICWGLDWVIQDMQNHPTKRGVVSMSVFAPNTDPYVSAMEHNINQVIAANIPVTVSANNQADGNCTTSPARMGYGGTLPTTYNTITVGGTEINDTIWRCANHPGECTGLDPGSNFGPCVSMYAPAHNLRLAHTNSFGGAYPQWTGYRTNATQRAGTSFASPFVAGLAARLLQQYPSLTAAQVWGQIRTRAESRSLPDIDPGPVTNNRLAYMSVYD